VHSPASVYAQGIDISFAFDLEPSLVEGCAITGGYEGIVSHFARVSIRENRVSNTTLRAITMTEMSMGTINRNDVSESLGVGIFCGDYSHCDIDRNVVTGTRVDAESADTARHGYAIIAHFGARAVLDDNVLASNPNGVGAFADAHIRRE
jgi:hypothetical protein